MTVGQTQGKLQRPAHRDEGTCHPVHHSGSLKGFNGFCYDSVAHRRKTYQAEDICYQDEG